MPNTLEYGLLKNVTGKDHNIEQKISATFDDLKEKYEPQELEKILRIAEKTYKEIKED